MIFTKDKAPQDQIRTDSTKQKYKTNKKIKFLQDQDKNNSNTLNLINTIE